MQVIEGILFEPVGCLAEFPAEPFLEIAARSFGRKKKASKSGSRAYWHLLNLIEATGRELPDYEDLEIQAADSASVYEDVVPALSELKTMGIRLVIASSLSGAAILRFLGKHSLGDFFDGVWTRDNAGGVKAAPLQRAISGASLNPERAIFLTDTAEGLTAAKGAGVQSILMMNDPDEARRLAMHDP